MAKSFLNNLKFAEGSRKRTKRIARGQGSGHGGTSTRGHKGQHSRSGANFRPWFEGGQMPLIRRVPKFGFTSPFREEYLVVNVSTLDILVAKGKVPDAIVTPAVLYATGAVAKKSALVKILGNGELKSKLDVSAHAFSASAKKKIEAAGGTVKVVQRATA